MSTTFNKKIIGLVQEHILNNYTLEELKQEVEGVKGRYIKTDYQALTKLVEGGSFLVYNDGIKDFLVDTLELSPVKKVKKDGTIVEYDDMEMFNLYTHLIARDGEKLLSKKGGQQ